MYRPAQRVQENSIDFPYGCVAVLAGKEQDILAFDLMSVERIVPQAQD